MTGMLKTLGDRHSEYLPPAEQKELAEELDAKFGGIGAHVIADPQTREIVILYTVYDAPAQKAGVLSGDKLLRIEGRGTQGMSSQDAMELLRGKPGEKVSITVLHPGQEQPVDLEIVREVIHIETVQGDTRGPKGTWNYFLPGLDKIAYVRITSFSENTAAEMAAAMVEIAQQNAKGLIVDVRDNPGGLLTEVNDICNGFLKKNDAIVTLRGRNSQVSYVADGTGKYTNIPMAVLVNEGSASASEIFAACMQDHDRATIVGQRTHGKGTVQHFIPLEQGCGAIRMTTSSYWRPSGRNIDRQHGDAPESEPWGVQPDPDGQLVLNLEQHKALILWRVYRDAREGDAPADDPQALRAADLQLAKAIECLLKKGK
jgi:carboxyl-terminal processing protease